MSSAFSGVGAPEQAGHCINSWFVFMLCSVLMPGELDLSLTLLWALELDEACKEELKLCPLI